VLPGDHHSHAALAQLVTDVIGGQGLGEQFPVEGHEAGPVGSKTKTS
jgi:hypothetical protein